MKICGDKWLELHQDGGYTYVVEVRGFGAAYVLPYAVTQNNGLVVACTREHLVHQPLGRYYIAGGHCHEDETPEAAAVRELKEETGIVTSVKDIESLGTVYQGKAMLSIAHLYAVPMTREMMHQAMESGNDAPDQTESVRPVLISANDVVRLSQDAVLLAAVARLMCRS